MHSLHAAASTEIATPAARFTVPLGDLKEFSDLPERRRVEVNLALRLLARVEALRGEGATLTQAIATVAALGIGFLVLKPTSQLPLALTLLK